MNIKKQITKNFNLFECFESKKAKELNINNIPNEDIISDIVLNLENILKNIAQPARDLLNLSITIDSGYRCPELNKVVGGSKNSQHMKGEALDIYVTSSRELNRELFFILSKMNFDQLIWEYSDNPKKLISETFPRWIHISLKIKNNRNEILIVEKTGTKKIKL